MAGLGRETRQAAVGRRVLEIERQTLSVGGECGFSLGGFFVALA